MEGKFQHDRWKESDLKFFVLSKITTKYCRDGNMAGDLYVEFKSM